MSASDRGWAAKLALQVVLFCLYYDQIFRKKLWWILAYGDWALTRLCWRVSFDANLSIILVTLLAEKWQVDPIVRILAESILKLLFLRLNEVEVLDPSHRVLLCRLRLEHLGASLICQMRVILLDSSRVLPILLLMHQLRLCFLPLASQVLLHKVSSDAHTRQDCWFPFPDSPFKLAHSHRIRFLIVSLLLAVFWHGGLQVASNLDLSWLWSGTSVFGTLFYH